MANFFDQFDEQTGANFFDQFDAEEEAPVGLDASWNPQDPNLPDNYAEWNPGTAGSQRDVMGIAAPEDRMEGNFLRDVPNIIARAPEQFTQGLERSEASLNLLTSEFAPGYVKENSEGPVVPIDAESAIQDLRKLEQDRKSLDAQYPLTSETGKLVSGAVESTGFMAPGMALGPVGMLGSMGLRTAGDTYGEARAIEGKSKGAAAVEGVIAGIAEAGFETIPAAKFFDLFNSQSAKSVLRRTFEYFGVEEMTELPTTLIQNVADIITSDDPDSTSKALQYTGETLVAWASGTMLDTSDIKVGDRTYNASKDARETALQTLVQTGMFGAAGKTMETARGILQSPEQIEEIRRRRAEYDAMSPDARKTLDDTQENLSAAGSLERMYRGVPGWSPSGPAPVTPPPDVTAATSVDDAIAAAAEAVSTPAASEWNQDTYNEFEQTAENLGVDLPATGDTEATVAPVSPVADPGYTLTGGVNDGATVTVTRNENGGATFTFPDGTSETTNDDVSQLTDESLIESVYGGTATSTAPAAAPTFDNTDAATGQPKIYADEAAATRVRSYRRLQDSHDVVAVDGGFILQPKEQTTNEVPVREADQPGQAQVSDVRQEPQGDEGLGGDVNGQVQGRGQEEVGTTPAPLEPAASPQQTTVQSLGGTAFTVPGLDGQVVVQDAAGKLSLVAQDGSTSVPNAKTATAIRTALKKQQTVAYSAKVAPIDKGAMLDDETQDLLNKEWQIDDSNRGIADTLQKATGITFTPLVPRDSATGSVVEGQGQAAAQGGQAPASAGAQGGAALQQGLSDDATASDRGGQSDARGSGRGGDAVRSSGTRSSMDLARFLGKVFGKKVVFGTLQRKGDTAGKITDNGLVYLKMGDTVFIDVRTDVKFNVVFGHEILHLLKNDNPKLYSALESALKPLLRSKEYQSRVGGDIEEQIADILGNNFDNADFWTQVEANMGADKFQSLSQKIVAWIDSLISKFVNADDFAYRASFVTDARKVRAILAKAVADYAMERQGVTESPAVESGIVSPGPVVYSARTINEWSAELDKTLPTVPKSRRKKIVDNVREMKALAELLDNVKDLFPHNIEWKKGNPLRNNNDTVLYIKSLDLASSCIKRLEYGANLIELYRVLDRAPTAGDAMLMVIRMREAGKEAPCVYCYVESPRRIFVAEVARYAGVLGGTVELKQPGKPTKKEITAHGSLDAAVAAKRRTYDADKAMIEKAREQGFKASEFDLMPFLTDEGQSKHEQKFPEIYAWARNKAQASSSQNAVKMYTDYAGQILKQAEATIRENGEKVTFLDWINRRAGLRIFSTSDFQIEHVFDLWQAIVDTYAVGMRTHAYTKHPAFVKIFGKTGIKINMSVFAVEQEDGTFKADAHMGMDWKEAQDLRDKHPNAGVIMVTTSDAMTEWALAQEWIDYIIPFHASGMPKVFYNDALNWKNLTGTQNEKSLDEKKLDRKTIMQEFAGDKGKTTEQTTRAYLELCKERNILPVFPQFMFKGITSAKEAKTKWQEMVKGKIEWKDINPNFAKLRKDYARTDTAFDVADPSQINMDEMKAQLDEYVANGGRNIKPDTAFVKKVADEIKANPNAGQEALAGSDLRNADVKASSRILSDAELEARIPTKILELVSEAEKLPKTHLIDTPLRWLHRGRIKTLLYGEGAKNKDRRADLILGLPASGKSTVADPLVAKHGALLIDPDAAKEKLWGFRNGFGASSVHEESSKITASVMVRALTNGDNIVYPMVGDNPASLQARIDLLKEKGYTVHLHYVDLPAEKAIDRAVTRHELTGRLVPPYNIIRIGLQSAQNFATLVSKGGSHETATWYDNDIARGETPVPVEGSVYLRDFPGDRGQSLRGVLRGEPDTGSQEVQQPVKYSSRDLTNTPEFKAWFNAKESNLVNEDGSPMVLYHGTDKKIDAFRRSKIGAMGPAVYTSPDRDVAEGYDGAGKGGQIVMALYARGKYMGNTKWSEYISKHGWEGAEAAAKAEGWSGVWDQKFEDAVAIWDPADIKSVENNGDFSEGEGVRYSSRPLAPNGKPSNLSPEQHAMVRTPAFKKWFGDWEKFATMKGGVWADTEKSVSKVVDENGEPLVVYHGTTDGGFTEFDSRDGKVKGAFFFTPDRTTARTYSGRGESISDFDEEGQRGIYEVFLNIRNPNEEDFEGANWDGSRHDQWEVVDQDGDPVYADDGRGVLTKDEADELADNTPGASVQEAGDVGLTTDMVAREGQKYGNDGAIIRNVTDSGSQGDVYDPTDIFIAFNQTDIKSATHNSGKFSAKNPDIRYSMRTLTPFFSKLERVVEQKVQGKTSLLNLKAMLRNAGVSPVEIDNVLAGLDGTIARQELLDHVKANSVEFEDVVLDDNELSGLSDDLNDYLPPGAQMPTAERRTHFGQYTLPGAVAGSYREFFVTAPEYSKLPFDLEAKAARAFLLGEGYFPEETLTALPDTTVISIAGRYDWKPATGNWKDGHSQYSEINNPIVRIRYNERQVDGKRVLFVEEMQGPSDANQEQMPEWLRKRIYDIGVKRVIAIAKEQGFDAVAWTTGQQQADRYDLSQQIDAIQYFKKGDTYDLSAVKDGEEVITKEGLTANELADVVGKEIAKSIVAGEGRDLGKSGGKEITGDGLRVGGEGLKNLYDSMLPKMFAKYAKGQIAVMSGIPNSKAEGHHFVVPQQGGSSYLVFKNEGEGTKTVARFPTQEAADAFANKQNEKVVPPQPMIGVTEQTPGEFVKYSSRRLNANGTPTETYLQLFLRKVQDRYNRVATLQEWITETGTQLSELANAARGLYTMNGKVADRLVRFVETDVAPLVMEAAKLKIPLDDINDYLLARHAAEANAAIQKLHGDPTKLAYGYATTDAEIAAAVAAGYDVIDARDILSGASTDLKRISDQWQAFTKGTADLLLREGLIDQDTKDAWDTSYGYYVPVRGDQEAISRGAGQGQKVNNRQKRRMGHGLRDEMVIENIINMREMAYRAVEKNKVNLSVAQMLLETNNPAVGTVGKPQKRPSVRNVATYTVYFQGTPLAAFPDSPGVSGQTQAHQHIQSIMATSGRPFSEYKVVKSTDPTVVFMSSPMLQPNEINAYVNGKQVRIQLNDEVLAGSLTAVGVEKVASVLNVGKQINNFLSRAYTGYDPRFTIRNTIRDALAGTINITGDYGITVTGKILANYPRAVKSLLTYLRTGDRRSDPWVDKYTNDGGSTGAAWLGTLEQVGEKMTTMYQREMGMQEKYKRTRDDLLRQGKSPMYAHTKAVAASGLNAARRGKYSPARWFIDSVEALNSVSENAYRLATYRTLVEEGKSRSESAAAAKNVTLNFDKRGEWGANLSALYLFFNPAIQGVTRASYAMFRAKHKAQVWGAVGSLAAIGYMSAQLVRALGDDDDEWEIISRSTKDRNLIFPDPTNKERGQITLPLPYEFSFFVGLGYAVNDAVNGKFDQKSGWNLASSFVDAFSPVGNPINEEANILGWFNMLPTALNIALAPALNQNNFGGKIQPTQYREDTPDSQNMWRNTRGTWYDKVATGLNEATGGSPFNEGAVDVSPESIKHYARSLMGGAYTFLDQVYGFAGPPIPALGMDGGAAWNGSVTEAEVPMVNIIRRENTVQDSRRAFNEAKAEAKKYRAQYRAANKGGATEVADELYAEHGELIDISKSAEAEAKRAAALRELIDTIRNDPTKSMSQRRKEIRAIEAEEDVIYREFLDTLP
jgi:predicted kinase